METKQLFALHAESDDPSVHKEQIVMLRRLVFGLAQDVATLKELLRERQVLDPLRFKELRTRRMVGDHSGAGAAPWRSYSYFPYLLQEKDYLRTYLGATDQEIEKFRQDVEFVSQLS